MRGKWQRLPFFPSLPFSGSNHKNKDRLKPGGKGFPDSSGVQNAQMKPCAPFQRHTHPLSLFRLMTLQKHLCHGSKNLTQKKSKKLHKY